MSRRKKLLLNTGTGFLKQVIVVICGFILPRYMILYYGAAVNGVVSSIANYLSFISLLDMGVGAVVQANLYKPLAEGDRDQISRIVISAVSGSLPITSRSSTDCSASLYRTGIVVPSPYPSPASS